MRAYIWKCGSHTSLCIGVTWKVLTQAVSPMLGVSDSSGLRWVSTLMVNTVQKGVVCLSNHCIILEH